MALAFLARPAAACAIALAAGPVLAIQTCELNGQAVNPNNGATTAGRSGVMRCRDADSGAVQREQELQNGKFVGIVRYFKAGQIEKEFSVNERGNKEGVSREWTIDEAAGKRVLSREETDRNGSTVGIARTWYPTGQRRRLTFYGDDQREQAAVEFTADGRLSDLRCASTPVFGSDFDDRAACGFAGVVTTVLYGSNGQPSSRIAFERGERRKVETLWDSGAVRDSRETTATGGVERSFSADGTKRREVQWVTLPAKDATSRGGRVNTLDQEFHESGKLVHEQRWAPSDRRATPVSETWWYLNGQMKELLEYATTDDRRTRRDRTFHDNGKLSSEGTWLLVETRFDRSSVSSDAQPVGAHKTFDQTGQQRSERIYDDRGRLTREREFDERGALVRDDDVFEDGSRKAAGR